MNNFFDILKDILLKESGGKLYEEENFDKLFSSFMLCRYISMRPSLIEYSEILNQFQMTLDKRQLYTLAYNIIPKQGNSFIKYISKAKKKKEKDED